MDKNVLTSVQSQVPIDVVALEKSVHGHLFNRHRRTVVLGRKEDDEGFQQIIQGRENICLHLPTSLAAIE